MLETQLNQLKTAYENLGLSTIDELLKFYAPNAIFKDPFVQVQGHAQIKAIFVKMFKQLDDPKFYVKTMLQNNGEVSILWEFRFRFKRWNKNPQAFLGVSWITLNSDFEIISHIDYWNPSEGIYEKLPILGGFMRFLKNSV